MPALLRRIWADGFVDGPRQDWVGTTDMDPAEPNFQNLLLEQAVLHVDRLSAFEGIAVDRLDYSEFFNLDADDGVSWVPRQMAGGKWDGSFGPARSLRLSYRQTFARISQEVVHLEGRAKIMLMNCNALCRIDQIEYFDGAYLYRLNLNPSRSRVAVRIVLILDHNEHPAGTCQIRALWGEQSFKLSVTDACNLSWPLAVRYFFGRQQLKWCRLDRNCNANHPMDLWTGWSEFNGAGSIFPATFADERLSVSANAR